MTSVQLLPGFTAHYPPRLQLVSAGIDDAHGPPGVHLRWFEPRSLPRPATYELYRFDEGAWRRAIAEAGTAVPVALDGDGQPGWSGRNRAWDLGGHALLVDPTAGRRRFLLRFSRPATAVEVQLAGTRLDTDVRAFHRSHALLRTTVGRSRLLEGPGITDLLVHADPAALRRLSVSFEADLVARITGRGAAAPVARLRTPTTVDEAYDLVAEDVAQGLTNRFVDTTDEDFRDRYPPKQVAEYVEVLTDHVARARPSRTAPAQHGMAPTAVDTASFLSLAALDPNVARMGAAYVVDRKADPRGDWRHVLVGRLAGGEPKFLVGYSRTTGRSDPPRIEAAAVAEQLPGITYDGGEPLGRVGVAFDRELRASEPTRPVLLDVDRVDRAGATPLTQKRPALVASRRRPFHVDTARRVGAIQSYRVRPIDLFGRVGEAVETGKVEVADLEAPVPPTGLAVRLDQQGFPWTDPADLSADGDTLRRGRLVASFRYGAGPTRVSPDAASVHLRWWQGPPDTRPADFAQWRPLTTVPLRPAVEGTVRLGGGQSLTRVALPVAEVAAHEAAATAAPSHADPATAAEVGVSPRRLELLVNRALLEPDLFRGYRCTLDGVELDVASSTAGIAFDDDDTPDKRLTARLVVESFATTPAPGTADVRLPAAGLTTSAVRAGIADPDLVPAALGDHGLVVDLALAASLAGAVSGGELAVDLAFTLDGPGWVPRLHTPGARTETFVLRVVGEHAEVGGSWRVLARVRPLDLLKLLLAERTGPGDRVARLHPPYTAGPFEVGVGVDAAVRVDLADDERFATLAVVAAAEDRGRRRGPMTGPVEARVVRPPPPPPAPPHPRDVGVDATVGFAGVPDAGRRSRVALAWHADPDLRTEVSRALDTSIVAADRARWTAGGLPHHRPLAATIDATGDAGDGQVAVMTVRGAALADTQLAAGAVVVSADARATVTAAEQVGSETWELTASLAADGDQSQWPPGTGITIHPLGVVTRAPFTVAVAAWQVQPNGIVRLELAVTGGDQIAQLRAATGGRIGVVHTGEPVRVHHRLVAIREHAGAVHALSRPTRDVAAFGPLDPTTPAEVEPPPEYADVLADDAALRRLADVRDPAGRPLLETAFGVVTGVPLLHAESAGYDDLVPGPGRSRFFYRVRAVAAGGAASAWSRPSVAFHQFPPRPEPLAQVGWAPHGDRILISWQRPLEEADAVEVAVVTPDGVRAPLGVFTDEVIAAPRFPPSPVILFDDPVEMPADGDGSGAGTLRVETADGPLAGRPVARTETGPDGTARLRVSGFHCTDGVPLAGTVVVRTDDAELQTVRLTDPDRRAVLVALGDGGPRRLELRAVTHHREVDLRSAPVEVMVDA